MTLVAFKEKLKSCHAGLYVRADSKQPITGEWTSAPLYLRSTKRDDRKSNYGALEKPLAEWLQAKESGNIDDYICGVPYPEVPEHDVFDLETGREIARGWRTIALTLVKKGIVSREKARKVFSASLGEADSDRWGYEKKVAKAREGTAYAERS